MRIILVALAIFTTTVAAAQTMTFQRVTYQHHKKDSMWALTLHAPLTVTFDTVAKKITIPGLQIWISNHSKRNMYSGVITTWGDTALTISGTTTYQMVDPFIINTQSGVKAFVLSGKVGALLYPDNGGYFVIGYPMFNGWMRSIEFDKIP